MNLRRTAMLDLDYPESPLLNARQTAAGVRLPNPLLQAPDGAGMRLYDLLPVAPTLLQVGDTDDAAPPPSVEHVVRIRTGEYLDPSGSIRRLLGRKAGWILVRPDAHVAWATDRPDEILAGTRHALGI